MNRAFAPLLCALAVFAAACDDDDDDDDNSSGSGDPSAPSGDPLSVYASNNGAILPGGVVRFDEAFAVQNAVETGNNEGVVLDHLGNLYHAGDSAAFGGVRVFARIFDRPSMAAFTLDQDRELGGGAVSGLTNPKGVAVAHGAGLLMIADFGASMIAVYGTAAGGDVAPLATTALSVAPWDLAYDESADRLFVAQTDGTVGVFDDYVDGGFAPGAPAVATRVIVPADGTGTQVSTNLHGIAYDAEADRLVVSDVGDTAVNDDGALYMFTTAASSSGNVIPTRTITGPLTTLGNPVDIALDDEELRVAEKGNDALLLFTDVFSHDGGDVAPRLSVLSDQPESLVLAPEAPSIGPDVSDIDDSGTGLDGVLVTSNPLVGAAIGDLRRLDTALDETASFEADAVGFLENATLDRNGDACVSFDDNAGVGGLMFVNRLAKGRDTEAFTTSRDRTITGASTLLVSPKGVEIVDDLGVVLVADNDAAAPSILAFGSCAEGDAAPLMTVALPAAPWDLDYDPAGDRLFIALTDGSVAVYDAFFSLPVPAVPDRVITISDGLGAQESVNLHGIVYDALNDALIVSDIGLVADASDGVIYTIDAAATADGLTDPTVRIAGAATLLGNPVDLAYNGQDLFVAEKANGLVLRFNDVLVSAGGDLAPDDTVLHDTPESICLIPSNLSPTSGGSIF